MIPTCIFKNTSENDMLYESYLKCMCESNAPNAYVNLV